ncbi:MAG: YqgE/AlgH family protein, partial [Gammaproteobacteria bacterium]|nr:YqgE/AlgH family protein [Gammaproteobacteria bacterium]
MTQQPASLVDKCLIATPAIKDPIFASSLVYMCEHNENGSMGLVVNHETSQVLDDIFQQLDIS